MTMLLKFQQFVEFVEVPQLQFFDRVVVQLLTETGTRCKLCRRRRFSSGAALGCVQYFDGVVDVPAAVHRQGLDVPVSSWRCLRFSSSAELDYDGSKGFFGAFCAIFRAPPVIRS